MRLEQRVELCAVGEVDGDALGAELGGEAFEDVGPAAGEDEGRAAGGARPRDGVADAAGGAGEQDGAVAKLHGQANTATVAVKACRKFAPPTGPISPAAKNPAAGAPASPACTDRAS